MDNRDVKRVIVIFKTHLDIGYTALAAGVLQKYREALIPAAIDLAERANADGKNRFVWTVGSYLVKHYFDHADEKGKARLDAAIRRGDVAWHGLACTTHTELMDEALFEYGLSLSKELDARFGKKTVAAKMTDVPGHTVAMVPLLARAGIEYLHIGVNTGSRVPEVPQLFRWRCGEDEIVVHYAGGYGEATVLENGVALEFCHALDNAGPPTLETLSAEYRALAARYPNAAVEAGTLDDFARAVREIRDTLPVVEQEIGDTWIHGVASDPYKVSRCLRLLGLRSDWVKSGRLDPGSREHGAFMEQLLLVAEHTWGMDVKKYLLDFTNWTKADFQAARRVNRTDYSFYSPRNAHILEALRGELREYRGDNEVSSYSIFEASHAEQRAYVEAALAALPDDLAREARSALAFAMPDIPEGAPCRVNEPIKVGGWRVTVGVNGELTRIENPALRVDCKARLGLFCYETFDGKTAADCFFGYGRDLKKNFHWAECDFSKPGLRYEQEIRRNVSFAVPDGIVLYGNALYIPLRPESELCERYGCPRRLLVVHEFGDTVKTTLYWKDKDAIRSPEAVYFGMTVSVSDPHGWLIEKLSRPVSPFRVVKGGNRKLHCAKSLLYHGADCAVSVKTFDSPLVSFGGRHLYDVDDAYGDPADGFWYLLHNNRWGTNFKQWFEDDMRFAFETKIAGNR
jgi:hypothetical protein